MSNFSLNVISIFPVLSKSSLYKTDNAEQLVCSCRVSWIQSIVVVVAKENLDLMTDIIQRFQHRKVRVVPGGSTRHRSICNGVLALGEQEEGERLPTDRPKVVIIHDAVRPFVEEAFLYKIAMAAKEQGVSVIKANFTKAVSIWRDKNFVFLKQTSFFRQKSEDLL